MRIGIIGAGQLGQMLGFAARDLGYECRFIDPSASPPAKAAGEVIRAGFDDGAALSRLASDSDVISYEFENVPVAVLEPIAREMQVYPPITALKRAQDRLAEKRLFDELDIPLSPYCVIDRKTDLELAVEKLGLPLVIKTRRLGYDGKGQFLVSSAPQTDDAWRDLAGRAAIAEAFVDFDFEVSVIGARNPRGDVVTWPLTLNEHRGGILRTSRAPFENAPMTALASDYLRRLMNRLNYVGVLVLELFALGERLMANEYAPRVHNSGHWTIEGAVTSQFTNHLLAITDQELGATTPTGHAGMLNLIGTIPDSVRHLTRPGYFLHDYGKSPRPNRKLGHITVLADSAALRDDALEKIRQTVTRSTHAPGNSA